MLQTACKTLLALVSILISRILSLFTWFLHISNPWSGMILMAPDMGSEHELKKLRKAFDYTVDIYNLHMVVSATYGYMASQ